MNWNFFLQYYFQYIDIHIQKFRIYLMNKKYTKG
jgi:hypothetical protein